MVDEYTKTQIDSLKSSIGFLEREKEVYKKRHSVLSGLDLNMFNAPDSADFEKVEGYQDTLKEMTLISLERAIKNAELQIEASKLELLKLENGN
jgi:hypothetical protein